MFVPLCVCPTQCLSYSIFVPLNVCSTQYLSQSHPLAYCLSYLVFFPTWYLYHSMFVPLVVSPTWCVPHLMFVPLDVWAPWCLSHIMFVQHDVWLTWCLSYFVFVALGVCANLNVSYMVFVPIGWCHLVFVSPGFCSTWILVNLIIDNIWFTWYLSHLMFASLNICLIRFLSHFMFFWLIVFPFAVWPNQCSSNSIFVSSNVYPTQCPSWWFSHLMLVPFDVFPTQF